MNFKNPYNPSYEEIKNWAYSENAIEPVQDWDIIVEWEKYPDLIIELVADKNCPTNKYFLGILYVLTGKVVRDSNTKIPLDKLFEIGQKNGKYSVYTWIKNSKDLLKNPEKFKYDDWFCRKFIE